VVMRSMPVPPLMHGAAQWVAFGAIHKGGTVVMQGNPEKLDPDDIWGTVERERVSTLAIVGDAFARPLLDGLDRKYDLSRLFVIGSGGAILSPHYKQAFLERLPHVTVVDGFGASETGAQGSHASRGGEAVSTGTFSMEGAVVLKQDLSGFVEPGAEELVAFAAQHLARYKLPKTTVLVDEMVRSPSGKPDYRWARARALEARGRPAG